MLLRWMEGIGIILFVIIVITQVVMPLWSGRRLFALFRRRQSEQLVVDARERAADAELTQAAKNIEPKLEGPNTGAASAAPGTPPPAVPPVQSGGSVRSRKRP